MQKKQTTSKDKIREKLKNRVKEAVELTPHGSIYTMKSCLFVSLEQKVWLHQGMNCVLVNEKGYVQVWP